jgi:hypothetical protein
MVTIYMSLIGDKSSEMLLELEKRVGWRPRIRPAPVFRQNASVAAGFGRETPCAAPFPNDLESAREWRSPERLALAQGIDVKAPIQEQRMISREGLSLHQAWTSEREAKFKPTSNFGRLVKLFLLLP